MQIFEILGFTEPDNNETFQPEFPTRQTELLSLGLRRLLHSMQGDNEEVLAYQIRQALPDDYDSLTSAASNIGGLVSEFLAEEEFGGVPDVTGLSASLISAIVPVLLSGGGLAGVLSALTPYLLEGFLSLVKNKLFGEPDTEALQAIADALKTDNMSIAQAVEIGFGSYKDGDYEISYLCDISADLNRIMQVYEEALTHLDSIDRLLQEIQEATPVAIMHTSEIDKVVYITP